MTEKNPDHRKANADRQRADVQRKVRSTLEILRAEVSSQRAPAVAKSARRLSFAYVLRRAGGVDKNTLKQPYHSNLRREIEDFLQQHRQQSPAKNAVSKAKDRTPDLEYYAQMLAASQIVRDDAVKKLALAEAEIERLTARISLLESALTGLRKQATNVIPIAGAGRDQAER